MFLQIQMSTANLSLKALTIKQSFKQLSKDEKYYLARKLLLGFDEEDRKTLIKDLNRPIGSCIACNTQKTLLNCLSVSRSYPILSSDFIFDKLYCCQQCTDVFINVSRSLHCDILTLNWGQGSMPYINSKMTDHGTEHELINLWKRWHESRKLLGHRGQSQNINNCTKY